MDLPVGLGCLVLPGPVTMYDTLSRFVPGDR